MSIEQAIVTLADRIEGENACLRAGDFHRAVDTTERREKLIDEVERLLARVGAPFPEGMRPLIGRLERVNAENALLLEAALRGQRAARMAIAARRRPVGYTADGSRLDGPSAKKPRSF